MTVCAFDLVGPYAYDLSVQVLWVLSIADVDNPQPAEIATGIDLVADYEMTDIIGWEIETDVIRDGIWGAFEEQRMGRQKIEDSRFLFAADRDGDDIRQLFDRGDPGFIVILPSGPYLDHPTAPVNVYPVIVSQLTQQQRLRTGGGSLILVSFVVSGHCGENQLIMEGS